MLGERMKGAEAAVYSTITIFAIIRIFSILLIVGSSSSRRGSGVEDQVEVTTGALTF